MNSSQVDSEYHSVFMPSFRLTFSDVVSHGQGMEQFGIPVSSGFNNNELCSMSSILPHEKIELHNIKSILPTTLYDIPDIMVLIMRGFFNDEANNILKVLSSSENSDNDGNIVGLQWDTQRVKNGKIVENRLSNKLVFYDLMGNYKYPSDFSQNRGTIYNYKKIPALNNLHKVLFSTMGAGMGIEADSFPNIQECYIPMAQEKIKRKNIGMILGSDFPLHFRWYHNQQSCSDLYTINLKHGDLYILSDDAAGYQKELKTKLYLKHGLGYNQKLTTEN